MLENAGEIELFDLDKISAANEIKSPLLEEERLSQSDEPPGEFSDKSPGQFFDKESPMENRQSAEETHDLGKAPLSMEQIPKAMEKLNPLSEEKSVREKYLGYASKVLSMLGTIGSLVGVICTIAGVAFPPIAIIGIVATCLSVAGTVCNIAINTSKYGTLKKAALGGQITGNFVKIVGSALSIAFPVVKLIAAVKVLGDVISSIAGVVCSTASGIPKCDASKDKIQTVGQSIDTITTVTSNVPVISSFIAFLKVIGYSNGTMATLANVLTIAILIRLALGTLGSCISLYTEMNSECRDRELCEKNSEFQAKIYKK